MKSKFCKKITKNSEKIFFGALWKNKKREKNFFTCSKKSIFDPNNLVSNKDRNDSLPASLSTLCSLGNLRFSKCTSNIKHLSQSWFKNFTISQQWKIFLHPFSLVFWLCECYVKVNDLIQTWHHVNHWIR